MIKRCLRLSTFSFLLTGLVACSQSSDAGNSEPSASVAISPTKNAETSQPLTVAVSPTFAPAKTASSGSLTQLFSKTWRVTKAPSTPASGSIYVFLPNGTLLQTSCVEPYRISTWTIDKKAPRVLRIVEDGQLAVTATIAQLTDTTLRLQQNLVRSNEKRNLTLTAIEQEFVCPDLPK